MSTPEVYVGSQLLDFLKNGALFRLFETKKNSCHCPFKQRPHQARIYQDILKEKLGPRTYTVSDQKSE
jgi:hypothetical protein